MNFQHLHDIEGLQFMPVKANKLPIIKGWQQSELKHDLSNCEAVGLICGQLSGGLEVIDVDTKYDLTGKLFDNYKRIIHDSDPSLLARLVIQSTKSGGFHVIYRCSKIEGNLKLANRPTTDEEKHKTYEETYKNELKKSTDDNKAREIASKASKNDKVRVLLETRGEGGYVMCYPSEGYKLLYGDFYGINEITPDERDLLHGVARQFNQVFDEVQVPRKELPKKTDGLSPFEDYNKRGDVVGLLQEHGWKVVGQKGGKTVFLRPGQTTSQSSGNFDHDKNWFSVFTTSTEFNPQHAYLPYAVFATLECGGNFSDASKKLYDLGFGDRVQERGEKPKQPSTRVVQSRVDADDNDYSFLATGADYDLYLQQVRDGTLPMGLTTGCPSLDEHFLFKEGNLVMVNGTDNVGKSVFMWWLLMIAAMYHGWKGIIFSSENTLGSFMRKMIQFYWGKSLSGQYQMSQNEYNIAKSFVENHFALIKAQEDLYNYKDIINMVKKSLKRQKYQYALIDPYNSLKIDLSGFSKLNTHEFHYEAASEIKAFGQKNKFGWFINMHAVTQAARAKDGEKKYPIAPGKADTEGGQKFPNKADDFATVHRLVGHPTEYMVTEFHVRKIKETDTGGRVTPIDAPVKFEMYKGGCGFIERTESGLQGTDPIAAWHQKINTHFPNENTKKPTTWKPFSGGTDIGF